MSLAVIQNNRNSDQEKPQPEAGPPLAEKTNMKIGKVEVDRDLCIGAESCVVVAPDAFEMDEENIALVKDGALKVSTEELLESAQACPVAAVILYDENGDQVYP